MVLSIHFLLVGIARFEKFKKYGKVIKRFADPVESVRPVFLLLDRF